MTLSKSPFRSQNLQLDSLTLVSVGDTRFSEEKWLYEPNYFSFAPIPTKIGQEVGSGVL